MCGCWENWQFGVLKLELFHMLSVDVMSRTATLGKRKAPSVMGAPEHHCGTVV